MGLFNKGKSSKSKADEQVERAEEVVSTKNAAKGGKKSRPKKGGMGTILKESVVETLLDDFSSNTGFILERNGEQVFVGLYLDTADIGGISKKSQRDEDKGQIIEDINSGRIRVLITPALMELEHLVILPDVVTAAAVSEYSLLMEAPYNLCYIWRDGTVERTDVAITFAEIEDVLTRGISIGQYLGDPDDELEPEPAEAAGDEPLEDDPYDGSEDLDDDGFGSEMDEFVRGAADYAGFEEDNGAAEAARAADEAQFEPEPVEMPSTDIDSDVYGGGEDQGPGWGPDGYHEGEAAEDPESEADDDDEIPDELVYATKIRRFYSDDLGLEISTAPFDAQFVHTNAFVPFVEERGDGFLDNHLAQMARDANTEMRRMHQDNLFRMRERYFSLVQTQCEDIFRKLDITDETTQVGQADKLIREKRRERLANIDAEVGKRKSEINEIWEARIKQVGEDAARGAEQQYRERYGRQHDEDLYRIEPEMRDRIEDDYQDNLRSLNDTRRLQAAKQLDIVINESLRVISEMYVECIEQERQRYNELRDAMLKFADENRKDDIARSRALADQLSQQSMADEVMRESQAKLKKQQADYDARIDELTSELDQMRRASQRQLQERLDEHEADMARVRNNHDQEMANLRSENDTLQTRVDSLVNELASMDARKDDEYKNRMSELRDQAASWSDKCDHMARIQKRSGVITVMLASIAVIAALSIGFVFGMFLNMRNQAGESQQAAVVAEYQQQISDLKAQNDALQRAFVSSQGTSQVPVTPAPAPTQPPQTTDIEPGAQPDNGTATDDGSSVGSSDRQGAGASTVVIDGVTYQAVE